MKVSINMHMVSGPHYKVQLSPFGPEQTGIYVVQHILHGDEVQAKREALSVAEHLCKQLNKAMEA
jgi:hypothetical protein